MAAEPVEVVSWDVDGTLYSLPRLRLSMAGQALRGLSSGRVLRDFAELRALSRWRARMDVVRGGGGDMGRFYARDPLLRDERELVRVHERRWYGAALARIGVRPEVGAMVAALRARGVRQVVLSDYDADYKLDALGLSGAFDAVYSGESLGWLKPSVELYRRVGAALGVAPGRWLHIGDRVDRDVVPARELGCQTLLIGRERLPAALLE